ncbi:MAG: carboxypeptidase-like regulatory domain-containing protein, partial [Chloroflexota bacterium]
PLSTVAPSARSFPESGKTVLGRFLAYWEQNGGLVQQGYPISDEMQERSNIDGKTYTVQYFERAVFELHPENQPPYDVLLSLLGTLTYREKYPSGRASGQPDPLPEAPAFLPVHQKCEATHDDSDMDSGAGFVPEAPLRQSVGNGLVLTGSVMSSIDCAPILGAKIEMRPEVGGSHPDSLRATLFTNGLGTFRFETDFPEHIHMRVSAHGFKTIIANEYHTSPGRFVDSFNIVLVPDPSCMHFTETGQFLCGSFLEYWKAHGALPQQGYPISDEFAEKSELDGKTYTVQYFERAVFELHHENKAPYDILLSQLGTLLYRAKYTAAPTRTPLLVPPF